MIQMFSITEESAVVDLSATRSAGYVAAYMRSRRFDKDDQHLTQNRTALQNAGIPFGMFADFDYRGPGGGGQTGFQQGNAFGDGYRTDPTLPPAFRLWPIDRVSVPTYDKYAGLLSESIYYAGLKANRNDFGIMGNLSTLRELGKYLNSTLAKCWVCVIYPSTVTPVLDPPYGKFPLWMNTLYTSVLPGVTNAAQMKFPGTLEQLATWAKDPDAFTIPDWSAQDPGGGDPGGGDPGGGDPGGGTGTVDFSALVAALDANKAAVETLTDRVNVLIKGLGDGWKS